MMNVIIAAPRALRWRRRRRRPALALARQARGQAIPRPDARAAQLAIEKGATLRVLRRRASSSPTRRSSRRTPKKFTEATGVEVQVDFVGWEDIRAADRGRGQHRRRPRHRRRLGGRPALYADKLVDLTDLADYLGKKYGGWYVRRREVRQEGRDQQLDRACRWAAPAAPLVYRSPASRRPASTRSRGTSTGSSSSAGAKENGTRPASRSATRSATPTAAPLAAVGAWRHAWSTRTARSSINSKETIDALKYGKELYRPSSPARCRGTTSSNNTRLRVGRAVR